jgi:hypothetical protein
MHPTSALLLAALALASAPSTDGWSQEELEAVTARIQTQVEALRGQSFERPVSVRITDAEGFLGYARKRMEAMSREDAMAREGDIARLLGLAPTDLDMEKAVFELLEGQVGGFYDPGSDTFYLMEAFTGGVAKVILAHELTHALDDQLYDLDDDFKRLVEDRDGSAAYQSVVEGSGTIAMSQWMMKHGAELTQAELMEAASMGTEELGSAPAVLWKPLLAAYTQGQAFLEAGYKLRRKDGATMTDVIAAAFAAPPTTMEQVLHPAKYWDPEQRDEPVEVVVEDDLPEGWSVLERGNLGELHVALLADEDREVDFTNPLSMMTIRYTNEAARGWDGDTLVLRGHGDARWLTLAIAWDSPEDAVEFTTAVAPRLQRMEQAVEALDTAGKGHGVRLRSVAVADRAPHTVLEVWTGADLAERAGR